MQNNVEYDTTMISPGLPWPFPNRLDGNAWELVFDVRSTASELYKLTFCINELNDIIVQYLCGLERINGRPRLVSTKFGIMPIRQLQKQTPDVRLLENIRIEKRAKNGGLLRVRTDGDPLEFHFYPVYAKILFLDLAGSDNNVEVQGLRIDGWSLLRRWLSPLKECDGG